MTTSVKSVARAAAALMVLVGLSLLRKRSGRGQNPALSAVRKHPIQSTPETSREAGKIMAGTRYEYAAVKVAQDQTPVPDLNKLGTDGYRIVATVGQLIVLERKVKGDNKEEEEED